MECSSQLIVQDYQYAQRSCVYINYKKMDEIGLNYGAVVLINNERNGKEFAYVALPAESVPRRAIGIHSCLRNLLYLHLRDKVTIKAAPSMWYWKNTNIQPIRYWGSTLLGVNGTPTYVTMHLAELDDRVR